MIDNYFLLFIIVTVLSVIATLQTTDSRLQELILYYRWCHDNNVDTPHHTTPHHTTPPHHGDVKLVLKSVLCE